MFLYRSKRETITAQASHGSANGTYYSDEIVWNTVASCGMKTIIGAFVTADRMNVPGLPWISLINSWLEDDKFYIKFILVGNNNSNYQVSPSIFVIGKWK